MNVRPAVAIVGGRLLCKGAVVTTAFMHWRVSLGLLPAHPVRRMGYALFRGRRDDVRLAGARNIRERRV
jgi:hypothetical protein